MLGASTAFPNNNYVDCFKSGHSGRKPECLENLDLTFWLYQDLESSGTQIKIGNLSTFDPSLDTRILGFKEPKGSWQVKLKHELLKREKMNVIVIIDAAYENAANDVKSLLKISKTRSVGVMVGHLLQDLYESAGASPEKFHLIAHSLGSHVMGYAGVEFRRLTGANVGRITGLDPAGSPYDWSKNLEILAKTNGDFVDVIHTDAPPLGGFGIRRPVGSADFYVNGAKNQPGCPPAPFNLGHIIANLSEMLCSHRRSVTLFINSVNKCQFRPDNGAIAGTDGCLMGFDAGPECRGHLDVTTTDTDPYC
ncbi:lipase member I isoform X2 [Aplysia californica]|uniref:Lipase member I isoform X2 n=1 Tax=Aplysia californica TaxID=6500 RepID=A0ABM0JIU3_APLCA|nr:lipase member I isoform X2 [Aplysia californica]